MIKSVSSLKVKPIVLVGAIFVALVTAGCGGGSSSSTSAPAPSSPSSTTSNPPTSSSVPAGTWPADVPSPTGLKEVTTTAKMRMYSGKGTADSVATQMTDSFTSAGYAVDGGQVVDGDSVIVTFKKGTTSILMTVSGTGTITCVLGLS